MNIWWIVLLVFLYFFTISCAFFTVRLAEIKGRRRGWGWLGFFLGLVGFIIVCFIPNAKGVEGETNPVSAVFRKLKGISPLALWVLIGGVAVVIGGSLLAVSISHLVEDKSYQKDLESVVSSAEYMTPSKVNGKVERVFCGRNVNYAVTQNGDLYGWGIVGIPAMDESGKIYQGVQKICSVGDTVYLLTADGTLYARGDNRNSLIPGQSAERVESFVKIEADVKDMALSDTAGAILKKSGNLYVVGVNTYGQLGRNAPRVNDTVTKMAGNVSKVEVTNRSLYYQTVDGNVYGVGNNAYGQFGLGNKESKATPTLLTGGCTDFAAGDDFLVVLKTNGTVWSAGNNGYGQLGRTLKDPNAVPVEGEKPKTPALEGPTTFGQLALPEGVTRLEAGSHSAFAFAGTVVYGWGHNHMGQLGNRKNTVPAPVKLAEKVVDLAAGFDCTLMLTEDGKLLGAGNNEHYRLGARNDGKGFDAVAEVIG